MSEEEEMITITKKKYDDLVEDSRWLLCLETAGVDNWLGIDYAEKLLEEMIKNEDD